MWNRFKNATELQTWRQGLSDWKDFNSDFGNIYPNGLSQDAESGGYGRASQSSAASASASSTAMNPAHRNHSGNGNGTSANAKEATDLSQIVVDQDEDEDDSKGVRPLMKVPPLTRAVRVVVVLTSVCRVSCRG